VLTANNHLVSFNSLQSFYFGCYYLFNEGGRGSSG